MNRRMLMRVGAALGLPAGMGFAWSVPAKADLRPEAGWRAGFARKVAEVNAYAAEHAGRLGGGWTVCFDMDVELGPGSGLGECLRGTNADWFCGARPGSLLIRGISVDGGSSLLYLALDYRATGPTYNLPRVDFSVL